MMPYGQVLFPRVLTTDGHCAQYNSGLGAQDGSNQSLDCIEDCTTVDSMRRAHQLELVASMFVSSPLLLSDVLCPVPVASVHRPVESWFVLMQKLSLFMLRSIANTPQ